MSVLSIFAHYDPDGLLAPHVLRHLDRLADVSDRLIVVSTAPLTPESRTDLQRRGELIERENEGYDFGSWRAGLEAAGAWWTGDLLLLVNDSTVGPLVPYADIVATMRRRGAAFWGITTSAEVEPHVQSYLLGFFAPALRLPPLRDFWAGVTPLPTRSDVIATYELGLSRAMHDAGLVPQGYLEPTPRDLRVARARRARAAVAHAIVRRAGATRPGRGPTARRLLRATAHEVRDGNAARLASTSLASSATFNPMIALWDLALSGRLPFAKIETLRDDPYGLGDDRMLAALEGRHPAMFDGVRAFLDRTRDGRSTRPGSEHLGDPLVRLLAGTIVATHEVRTRLGR